MRLKNLIRKAACWLVSIPLCVTSCAVADDSSAVALALLTPGIPLGVRHALSGSQFAATVTKLGEHDREAAILKQLLAGNLPNFLKKLIPVDLRYQHTSGAVIRATIFVMPEYLAIGSDHDFLRIPMNLHTAAGVASKLGFVLPTRKMVDAIYARASVHFLPQPMPAGPQMRSTGYYETHNARIEEQSRQLGVTRGSLVSGDKKDVVVTNRLLDHPERIAIYGWHRANGEPIQPLSTVHGACYADYSHGIRLVSETVLVDGKARSIYDVLSDPLLAPALSDEGPIPHLREMLTRAATDPLCEPVATHNALKDPYFTSFTQRNPR